MEVNIEKLTVSNYSTWCCNIKALLMKEALWDTVLSTKPKKADDADVDPRSCKGYSLIYLSVSNDLKTLINEVCDAKEAWDILKNYCRPSSRARVMTLLKEFFSERYRDGDTIGLYSARLKCILSQLKDCGHSLDNVVTTYQLMQYLSPEFDSYVQSAYRYQDEDFTYDKILAELLQEESRVVNLKPSREVEKIKKCFSRLEECKNNEWRFEEEDSKKLTKKKIPVKKEFAAFSKKDDSSKFRALAARQRLAEAKKKMLALHEQQKQQNFVEILEPAKDGFKITQNLNSENKERLLNTTESTSIAMKKESNENLKDLCVNRDKISSVKTSDQFETVITNEEVKYKANVQKSFTPSIQNKENFVPDNAGSNLKNNSKMQIKLKERSEVLPTKKRGKPKDYGKLQCVTRSAKKALLAQQNTMQK